MNKYFPKINDNDRVVLKKKIKNTRTYYNIYLHHIRNILCIWDVALKKNKNRFFIADRCESF